MFKMGFLLYMLWSVLTVIWTYLDIAMENNLYRNARDQGCTILL